MDFENSYRELFDLAADAMFILGHDGYIKEVNRIAYEQIGYTKPEMLGKHIGSFLLPEYAALLESKFAAIQEQGSLIYESVMVRKDGSILPVEICNRSIELGEQNAYFAIVRDISERKRAEEVFLKTHERLELAQRTSGSGVWEWNMTTDHFDWSLELFKIFGLDPAKDVPGVEIWRSILHPEDFAIATEPFERAVRDGTQLDSVFRIVRRDGMVRWINTLGRTTYDESRQQSRMIGICLDITERKQAEEALQKKEEQTRLIFETLSEGVALNEIVFNENGEMIDYKILEVNDAFYKVADFNKDMPVIGQMATKLYGIDIEAIELFWENHQHAIETLHAEFVSPLSKNIYSISTSPFKNNRFVTSFRDITEYKQVAAEIERLAYHDALTGLSNRLLLLDRLKQALVSSARNGRAGALLFIDLDNFKSLNDTLGHDTGDLLLQQVSQRLTSCIREGDTLARLGGDEFVVMLLDLSEHHIEAAAQSENIGEKILIALSQPYQLDNYTHRCTASIGVTLFSSNHQAADELMKQADIAMYQAKKAGRNALRFFDRQMQENVSARVSLEGELHNALEFQQFHLYYQIQVDSSNRPLGAEALIRWIHPVRGLVSPAQFIPLAEDSGLILPIGQWVLETACAQLKAWQQMEFTRDLTLAVNVSARQFHQTDFVAQVQAALQRHAINPKRLKLELTESLLQENIEDTIAIMTGLNECGIQFSLDDFGTGYSSLQYLKRLPLDQIKIDQSFVHDITKDSSDIAVVRATIAMARSLNLEVIAEGVETEEQQQLLLKNGCAQFQGYLFGRPVPIEAFEALLKQG